MSFAAHGKFLGTRAVIFGAGYIGGAVAEALRSAGASVTAVTRNPATAEALRAAGIEVVVADLVAGKWRECVATRPDFVLYSASAGGQGNEGYLSSYLHGIETVLAWLAETGRARTFVYTSSTSVYPQDGGIEVDETAPTVAKGDDRRGILSATEHAVAQSAQAYERYFVLRLAGIYGPKRHALLDETRTGTVSGRPEQRLNLIHRDDVVSAIVQCFAAEAAVCGGIFNVSDDAPPTRGEVVNWVAAQLGMAPPHFTGEPRGMRRAAPLDRRIASAKIREKLGWGPRFASFRDGYLSLLAEPTGA